MEIYIAVLRTLFFYFFITICYRIMGKRELGQLGIVDLIVSILIAELVAISIENLEQSIFLTIIPIGVLVLIEVLFAFIGLKCKRLRTFFTGKPSIIINHGTINYKEMIKQRYNLDDLMLALRQSSIKSIDEVEYAFLESNGKLSIFKYNYLKTNSDYPFAIIIDGKIQYNTLKEIGKSKLWLKRYLTRNEANLSDIFYAFYKNKKIYMIKISDIKNV